MLAPASGELTKKVHRATKLGCLHLISFPSEWGRLGILTSGILRRSSGSRNLPKSLLVDDALLRLKPILHRTDQPILCAVTIPSEQSSASNKTKSAMQHRDRCLGLFIEAID